MPLIGQRIPLYPGVPSLLMQIRGSLHESMLRPFQCRLTTILSTMTLAESLEPQARRLPRTDPSQRGWRQEVGDDLQFHARHDRREPVPLADRRPDTQLGDLPQAPRSPTTRSNPNVVPRKPSTSRVRRVVENMTEVGQDLGEQLPLA